MPLERGLQNRPVHCKAPPMHFCVTLDSFPERGTMKKRIGFIFVAILLCYGYAWSANLILEGDMGSYVRFNLERKLTINPDIQQITLSFVIPPAFSSPTGKQGVEDFKLTFSPGPDQEKKKSDLRGNQIVESTWVNPPEVIDVSVQFKSRLDTELKSIETTAAFPMGEVPHDIGYYLAGTRLVQKDHPRIVKLASSLTKGATTQYEAVGRIMAYVVDHIHYVNPSTKYDAIYTLEQGKGNCQNFSHLNAALMRALGIPVRIVNGITLNRPFQIVRSQGEITIKMGQGRHSWVEVWFPDMGWVPFDPQQTAMFVPNRYIRIEVGIDNSETVHDGLIRWSQKKGTRGEPGLKEVIKADFTHDKFHFIARKEHAGQKNFLLAPYVMAEQKKTAIPALDKLGAARQETAKKAEDKGTIPPIASPGLPGQKEVARDTPQGPPEPSSSAAPTQKAEPGKDQRPLPGPTSQDRKDQGTLAGIFENLWAYIQTALGLQGAEKEGQTKISHKSEGISISGSDDIRHLTYDDPLIFGNLEFPEDVDFAFPPSPVVQREDGSFEKVRAFWVETAEYVTSQRNQYCQIFIVQRPMKLEKIGLALHYFGGEGQLWVDLYGYDQGKPGSIIGTSRIIDSRDVSTRPGYRWMDFDFKADHDVILPPGAYWIGLGFTGSPIVNWFYSYGKPVGPAEGTRYKGIYETEWSGALPYEFNYRIMGLKRRDQRLP
jgi:hypothetical protein